MKHFLFVIFACCLGLAVRAQNIKVESFEMLSSDLSARTNVVRDGNNEECALIKVVTGDKSYEFDTPLGIVKRINDKPGEIWLYVPQGTKKLTITHPKLGTLRDYSLPTVLALKTTYALMMSSDKVEIIVHEDAGGQYLMMQVEPADATVFIDGVAELTKNGALAKFLKYGEHTYRVEHPLHETREGQVSIGDRKERLDVKLVPAFGFVDFSSEPAGAEVSANGKVLGCTPFKSEAMREGTYRFRFSTPSYADREQEVTVRRGETVGAHAALAATFGFIHVETHPAGAEIYINGMKAGTSPFRSDKLPAGTYRVKAILPMYAPAEQEISLAEGQTATVNLNPEGNFAEVDIRCEQPQADIYVNNELKGKGGWTGRLTPGLYLVESRMAGHRTQEKPVEVTARTPVCVTLASPTPIVGSLNITSTPIDATVKIDGRAVGSTPDIFQNLLVGEHTVEVTKEGCAPMTQRVMIEEGGIATLNAVLSQGKEVAFSTNSESALVSIDGETPSKLLPFKRALSYGTHTLMVLIGDTKQETSFTVTEHTDNFCVNSRVYTERDVPANPQTSMSPDQTVIIGSKAYMAHGRHGPFSEIWEYDFITQEWNELPLPPGDDEGNATLCAVQGCLCIAYKSRRYDTKSLCAVLLPDRTWKNHEENKFSSLTRGTGVFTLPGNGTNYLYVVSCQNEKNKYELEVCRKDVLTGQSQILYTGKLKSKNRTYIFADGLKLSLRDETSALLALPADRSGKNQKYDEPLALIPLDTASLPRTVEPPLLVENVAFRTKTYYGTNDINWDTCPIKNKYNVKRQTVLHHNKAYVLFIEKGSKYLGATGYYGGGRKWHCGTTRVTNTLLGIWEYDFLSGQWKKADTRSVTVMQKSRLEYQRGPGPDKPTSIEFDFRKSDDRKYLQLDGKTICELL